MSALPNDSTRRIRRVLSTRSGGASAPPYDSFNLGDHVGDDPAAVRQNRDRLAAAIGVAAAQLVWMEQVHGRDVAVVDSPQSTPLAMTDALVTATPGLVLNVLSADCIPMLLWDEQAGVIAAAHAGRPGVRLDIAAHTVAAMQRLGARAERIEVLFGPSICGSCYEVPPDMQADIDAVARGSAVRTRTGTAGLDLRVGARGQLAAVGVTAVQVDSRCTAEDPTLYSYRRDGRTGRQSAAIWIEGE